MNKNYIKILAGILFLVSNVDLVVAGVTDLSGIQQTMTHRSRSHNSMKLSELMRSIHSDKVHPFDYLFNDKKEIDWKFSVKILSPDLVRRGDVWHTSHVEGVSSGTSIDTLEIPTCGLVSEIHFRVSDTVVNLQGDEIFCELEIVKDPYSILRSADIVKSYAVFNSHLGTMDFVHIVRRFDETSLVVPHIRRRMYLYPKELYLLRGDVTPVFPSWSQIDQHQASMGEAIAWIPSLPWEEQADQDQQVMDRWINKELHPFQVGLHGKKVYQSLNEKMIFEKGKGLVDLRQSVGGVTTMEWTRIQ